MYKRQVKYLDKERVKLIACGPASNDLNWTRRFFDKLKDVTHPSFGNIIDGYSIHYYCGTAGNALEFSQDQWYELLDKAAYMERIICEQRALMDSYDPQRQIGIVVDEWGCWHPKGSGPSRGENLFEQQNTMRDALVAAITLNIFNNHCDKVVMANVAQLVNCLHSLFLASGDKFVATPNYHVFDMYKGHQEGEAVRVLVDTDTITYKTGGNKEKQLARISCSASIKDNRLTLTLANCHYSEEAEVRIDLYGARFEETATKMTLNAADPHMYNSFEQPGNISPVTREIKLSNSEPVLVLPPASIVALTVELSG